jgi:hypothetical protein
MISGKKVIGIVGTRQRDYKADWGVLKLAFLVHYKDGDIICSGGCPKGADKFAKDIATTGKLPYLEFPADWDKHGKAAGFIRNTQIAEACDILIATVVESSEAKGGTHKGGTEDTIRKFKQFMKEELEMFALMSNVRSGLYIPKRKLVIL